MYQARLPIGLPMAKIMPFDYSTLDFYRLPEIMNIFFKGLDRSVAIAAV